MSNLLCQESLFLFCFKGEKYYKILFYEKYYFALFLNNSNFYIYDFQYHRINYKKIVLHMSQLLWPTCDRDSDCFQYIE